MRPSLIPCSIGFLWIQVSQKVLAILKLYCYCKLKGWCIGLMMRDWGVVLLLLSLFTSHLQIIWPQFLHGYPDEEDMAHWNCTAPVKKVWEIYLLIKEKFEVTSWTFNRIDRIVWEKGQGCSIHKIEFHTLHSRLFAF